MVPGMRFLTPSLEGDRKMKTKQIIVSGLLAVIGLLGVMSAQAQSNITSGTTATNNNSSGSTAANEGVSQGITFNSTSPDSIHEHLSGITGSNTAVGLGSFSSSFSSDYCGGTAQAGVSAPYVTIAAGKPVLGDPGVACVKTRALIHTMEISATYGNAAKTAVAAGNTELAAQYMDLSKKLAQAAVNMQCSVSPEVRQALVDAGVACPATAAEKSAQSAAAAEQVKQDALARGEPLDPLVRQRNDLEPLAVTQ
jgi:hypothetical protein